MRQGGWRRLGKTPSPVQTWCVYTPSVSLWWHMKWTTFISAILALFVLLIAGWSCYIGYLTKARDRACLVSALDNRKDISSPISMELQDVINDYSSQNGGIGLQVTVIFWDKTSWDGVAGNASIGDQCPMTLQHHLLSEASPSYSQPRW